MAFDPSTLCARTAAGEAELATPSQGLALGQRRVLTLLQNPVAVDELAQKHRLDPDKLSRDLTRLADLKLVLLQAPSLAPTFVPAAAMTDAAPMAPVVIGRNARLSPTIALAAGIAAIMLAAGIWYGTRVGPAPAETTKPTIAAPAPTPVPAAMVTAPAPPVVSAPSKVNTIAVAESPATAVPAPARTLRETTARTVARPRQPNGVGSGRARYGQGGHGACVARGDSGSAPRTRQQFADDRADGDRACGHGARSAGRGTDADAGRRRCAPDPGCRRGTLAGSATPGRQHSIEGNFARAAGFPEGGDCRRPQARPRQCAHPCRRPR